MGSRIPSKTLNSGLNLAASFLRSELEKRIHRPGIMLSADREPLSPKAWIENPHFSGPLATQLWDMWKEHFVEIYEKNKFVVVLGGSIGCGKTTFAQALQMYSLYQLSCYNHPQRAFRGMIDSAQILQMNFNVNETKAKDAYLTGFRELVQATPYFQKEFPFQKILTTSVRFPQKNILCKCSGATRTAAESENLIFAVLDEVNLYEIVQNSKKVRGNEVYDAAEVVYASCDRRMRSRFMLPSKDGLGGTMPNPAKIVLLCRETYPDSFIRRRIKEIRKSDQQDAHVVEFAEWEPKPPGTYSGKMFYVKTGDVFEGPRILDDSEVDHMREKLESIEHEDEKFEVIGVPIEWKPAAIKGDLPEFIRDVCGRPTEAISLFFRNREKIRKIWRVCSLYDSRVCSLAFRAPETNLKDGVVFEPSRLVERDPSGGLQPILNPGAVRYIHIDTALTGDCLGFAMGHLGRTVEVSRVDESGKIVSETAPKIEIDLALRIRPPEGGEINFGQIRRDLVYRFRALGFRIGLISADSFQSRDFLQVVRGQGFETVILSVDTDITPYKQFRNAVEENRLRAPWSKILSEEMIALEKVRTGAQRAGVVVEKVDHPPKGSKDVADAVAAVVSHVEQSFAEGGGAVWSDAFVMKDVKKPETEAARGAKATSLFESGDYEAMMNEFEVDEW